MAKFDHPEHGYFTIPDRPTVGQQLAYYSLYRKPFTEGWIEAQWKALVAILTDWKVPNLPDPHVDLETVEDPEVAQIIIWVVTNAMEHMAGLDNIPKDN